MVYLYVLLVLCVGVYTLEWYTFMGEVICSYTVCVQTSDLITLWTFIILFHFDTDGFNGVFPMEKLHAFSPDELVTLICGDQYPNWSREDILNYTEPKQGYTKER